MYVKKNIYLYQTEAPDEKYYLDSVDYVRNDVIYALLFVIELKYLTAQSL